MKLADTPTIERHLPERRRRSEIRMCHGSCCCCCCCLHTVGGIIGAGIAPAFGRKNRMPISYYYDEEYDIRVPSIAKPGFSAVKVFWMLTLAATVIGTLLGALASGGGGGGGGSLIVGLVILLLVFPALQLGCVVITLIWLALSSRHDKSYQLRQVGKLSVGLFAGTAAGIGAMFVLWGLFVAASMR